MKMEWIWMIPLFLVGFAMVHLTKLMRLYLILLEQKIDFKHFVLTYLKTTFVNLLIPFKLGELFRVYCFAKETKEFQVGLFSVIVDRFFDTVALLIILIPFELFLSGNVTFVTAALTVFSTLAIFMFSMFPGIYTYLNRYIIRQKTSHRSMLVLRGLEITKVWYDYVRNLIIGRYALVILLSCIAWLAEIGVLFCLSAICGISFGIGAFSEYIAAIFMSGTSELLKTYSLAGISIIGLATIAAWIVLCIQKKRMN